MLKAQGRLLS